MDYQCTFFPEGNWNSCCVGHDYAYADGGNLKDKVKADLALYKCVKAKGHPFVGMIMLTGLSIGGYFRFRWGK